MKFFVSYLFFFLPFGLLAQANGLYFPNHSLNITDVKEMEQYCKYYFSELQIDDVELRLAFQRKTNHSCHYSFDILYQDLPILNAGIKLNVATNGRILSIKKECPSLNGLINFSPQSELEKWSKVTIEQSLDTYWPDKPLIHEKKYKLFMSEGRPEVVIEINAWDKSYDKTIVLNLQQQKILEYDHTRNLLIDTLVNAYVFNPDPLTTINQAYGGLYKDLNDANSSWMNAAYVNKQVAARFDNSNNTFYLENPYAKIEDFEVVNIAAATSNTPNFLFNRSESGFEDVNALYHITHFHDHISSLGYDTLMDLQLIVDTHGQFGSDNSVFNRNGGNPTVSFGTGGVDDAEDADVIIHEYCHGVSWSANNNSSFAVERAGLDEGLADYFATSYSREISNYHWDSMFTWDGHNEFWAGRNAATPNNYPSSGNIYAIGEIWNCAMSLIWTDLGRTVTDKLMLEALHFFTDQTTLPEAAVYILQADTILFGGIHSTSICNRFQQKNIFDANCKMVGLSNELKVPEPLLANSLAFAENSGTAILRFHTMVSGSYQLVDMFGHIVLSHDFKNRQSLNISPFGLQKGMYLLRVNAENKIHQFKLNKFR